MGDPPGCDDSVALSLNLMHTLRNQSFWGNFTIARVHVIVEHDEDVMVTREWWLRFARVKRLLVASVHVSWFDVCGSARLVDWSQLILVSFSPCFRCTLLRQSLHLSWQRHPATNQLRGRLLCAKSCWPIR